MSSDLNNYNKFALAPNLYQAFVAMTGDLRRTLRQAGIPLTFPQFQILEAVFNNPGLSQSDLAKETAKDNAAITRSLVYLEKQGLVERKWINGCAKGVFVTAQGEKTRLLLEDAIRKTCERARAGMQEEQIICLNKLLIHIKLNLTITSS